MQEGFHMQQHFSLRVVVMAPKCWVMSELPFHRLL